MPGQGLNYNVDIVMCIDCTGSMGDLLESVKANALKFYPDLKEACAKKDKEISELRIKVVAFRDFNADRDNALETTDFFSIPAQEDEFKRFIGHLTPRGGGDEPENGLEALALAMKSDWTTGGDKRRHVIVVWTDASTHPLENPITKNDYYPQDMPKNLDELTNWWEDEQSGIMPSRTAKRLVIFAPDASSWTDIGLNWGNTIHHPAKAGLGLSDVDYETILATIANSI